MRKDCLVHVLFLSFVHCLHSDAGICILPLESFRSSEELIFPLYLLFSRFSRLVYTSTLTVDQDKIGRDWGRFVFRSRVLCKHPLNLAQIGPELQKL